MARGNKTYPAEIKRRIVELVRAGRSPEELGKEFEPSANTIRNWATQSDIDEGLRADGLSTAERKAMGTAVDWPSSADQGSMTAPSRFLRLRFPDGWSSAGRR
jgi:transposase-like protein